MTTPHRTLQMALDALDAITDDVDGTGLNTMPSFDGAIDAIAALREALAPDHLRDVAEKAAPAEPVNREHAIALRDAELCGCEDMYFAARPQIDTLQARRIYAAGFKAGYEVRPPAQPLCAEPVAMESVHLTRDINGMCTVRVNGRIAIHDNGDIIDHMATLEWFAQPAPVPLTDDRLHTFLNAAAGEGLVLDGVDAADLYIATFPERYAAVVASIEGHGIAASPEQPK